MKWGAPATATSSRYDTSGVGPTEEEFLTMMTGLETDRESHPGAIVEQLASSQSAPICLIELTPALRSSVAS